MPAPCTCGPERFVGIREQGEVPDAEVNTNLGNPGYNSLQSIAEVEDLTTLATG